MAGTVDLSLAFLESHPADAARVLERIAPQNVAALLSDTPMRIAAPVLRMLLPLHAARCIETLDDDIVSGLLRALGPQAGVALLHYVPESRRTALLAQMPTALSMTFRLLLGYPEDTVGAWMEPQVLALPADTTAETVLQRVRDAAGTNDSIIFVIDQNQHLLGEAALSEVLRASPSAPLSKLMQATKYTLPARTAIRAVEEHPGWDDHQMLPVVEREDRFVGSLNRSVLTRALLSNRRTQPGDSYGDVLANVASSYWLSVTALIQMVVTLIPVTPSQPEGNSHER